MQKTIRLRLFYFTVVLLMSLLGRTQSTDVQPVDINVQVESYEKLVQHEKNQQKKLKQELNLLVSYSELAKSLRSSTSEQNSELKKVLKKSVLLAKKILIDKNLEEKKKPYIHYLLGIALMDMNETSESMVHLKKTIELDPAADYAPSVSIFIGDTFFYDHKWKEAQTYYKQFYSKLSAQEKNNVNIKLAQISLKQSNVAEGQQQLENILKEEVAEPVRLESMKTLTASLAERSSQQEALEKSRRLFKNDVQRLEFLKLFYQALEKYPNKTREIIVAEIIRLEKNPEARSEIWLSELRHARIKKQFQSRYEIFKQMIADLKEDFIFSQDSQNLQNLLVPESESVLADYYKAYKMKSTSYDGPVGLLKLIEFQLKFKDQKKRSEVAALKIELLTATKDDKGLIDYTSQLLTNEPYLIDTTKLHELRVDALKRLLVTDSSVEKSLIAELEILSKEGKSIHQAAVAEELYSAYAKTKNWHAAEVQADLIFKKKPTAEHLGMLLASLYQQNDCTKIMAFESTLINKEISDYKRECALKLAESAKAVGGDRTAYYKNIRVFIQSSTDKPKKELALKDLFVNLKKDGHEELIEEYLLNDYFPLRFESSISAYTFTVATKLIYQGQWASVKKLMSGCAGMPVCPEGEIIAVIASVAVAPTFNPTTWNKSSEEQKNYFLGLWALLNPKEFISALMQIQKWTVTEKKLVAIAAEVSDVDWNQSGTKQLFSRIQDLVPQSKQPLVDSQALKALQKISFPTNVRSHNLNDQELMIKAEQIRRTRPLVLADLRVLGRMQKVKLLEAASQAENNAAQMIEFSKVPSVLIGVQILEYKKGLKTLANEFFKQQQQYNLSLGKVTATVAAATTEKELPAFKTHEDWLAKNLISKLPGLLAIWKSGNFRSCLMILDFAYQQKLITDQAYFRARAGVLLSTSSSAGMKNYVLSELQDSKQQPVIKFWRNR